MSPLVYHGPVQLYNMLWDHLYIKPLGGLVGWECTKVEKLIEVLMHCQFSNPFVTLQAPGVSDSKPFCSHRPAIFVSKLELLNCTIVFWKFVEIKGAVVLAVVMLSITLSELL